MIKRLMVFSLGMLLLAAPASAQTAAQLHGDPGCAPSPFAGNVVTLTGVVYCTAGTYNSGSTYFQTADGGMIFFESGNPLLIGDEISITGTIGAFGEEIQYNGGATWTLLSQGNPVAPIPIGTGDLLDGTDQLGNFMSTSGVLSQVSIGFNSVFRIDDGTGAVIVFIDGTTGINVANLQAMVGDIVGVQGATKCFGGEGEILPRSDNDIWLITVANEDASVGEIKSQYE